MPDGSSDYSDIILRHYRDEATALAADPSSTMRDNVTRRREIAAVMAIVDHLVTATSPPRTLLEIGCGNGHLLELLRDRFPDLALSGLEYTPEMVEVAVARGIPDCSIVHGDVRDMALDDGCADVVVTERCLVNVMDRADQQRSLEEIARVLAAGGHYLCIEAFTDGLEQLNEAREELGLDPNQQPHHNMWFDKAWFHRTIEPMFAVVDLDDAGLPPSNFLSSHYFTSRVLYPAVTAREVMYNTHLVEFLSFLPPMGNYSPIQLHLLRKLD